MMEMILCLLGGFCIGCIFMMFFLLDGREDTPPIIEPEQPILLIEKTNEVIETYKSALEMACEDLWNDFNNCDNCPVRNDIDTCNANYCGVASCDLEKYYLNKARKERK